MIIKIFSLCIATALSLSIIQTAKAGKVEDIVDAVKKSCGKDIEKEAAMRQVKTAFVSCVPGNDVEVDGCKIKCLKENSGAVVGQ